MKKIALQLFGQPRSPVKSIELLKENIIDANNIDDIFYHFWWNPEQVGQYFSSAQPSQNGHVGTIQPDTDKILLNELKPKKYIFEPQKEFPEAQSLKQEPTAKQSHLMSAFYSRWQSNNLRKQYEQENNIEYDAIICARLDIYYFHEIYVNDYINELNDGKLILMDKFQSDQDNFNNIDKPMTDMPCVGKSPAMDIYCSAYENFTQLNKEVSVAYGENILGRHCRVHNNLQLHKVNWNMNILHRIYRF